MRVLPKEINSVWTLFTGPAIWAAHFLVCYVWGAVHCAKLGDDGSFALLRGGIGVATLIALGLILVSGYLAWRQWGFGVEDPPHDDPNPRSQRLFQGFATLLLSALSFVAVIFTAMPALFITACVP